MPLAAYLAFGTLLFGVGLFGLLQRRSLVSVLVAIDLMLAAVSVNVVALTTLSGRDGSLGLVVSLILVGVAAAETAVVLSLSVAAERRSRGADVAVDSEAEG